MQAGLPIQTNARRSASLLNRRHLLMAGGLSATLSLGACATAAEISAPSSAAPPAPDTSTPQRKWAVQHLRGMLNLLFPSFKADLETLDEEGIRLDVRQSIAQGFSGTLPMLVGFGADDPRWEQYHRIIIDEAAGNFPVHGLLYGSTPEQDIAMMRRLEAMGVDLFLLASVNAPDLDNESLYQAMHARIAATEKPMMIYAALGKGRNYPALGPAGQPLDVFDRLADLPNVTSVKISQPVTLTSTLQICERVADRLLVAPVNLDFLPLLARHYHMQWSGQWNAEAIQTPARQLGNELLKACAAHDFERADAVAVQLQPALDHFFAVQAGAIRNGGHPLQHNKYYVWLSGGNGGLVPVSPKVAEATIPTLDAPARAAMRAAFIASGLTPTDAPEEQFIVGRAAWERGVRPGDMSALPRYKA